MDYETLDWELEAARVKAAFGVDVECRFEHAYLGSPNECRMFINTIGHRQVPCSSNRLLAITHTPLRMTFHVGTRLEIGTRLKPDWEYISLDYANVLCESMSYTKHGLFIARALFHLDLLTPKIEAALKVRVTAHSKLEWVREYEARNGL